MSKTVQKGSPAHLKSLLPQGRKLTIGDFDLRTTVGTGTFGRVRVVKVKGSADRTPLAMKILKKSEVIRLKQVEHVKAEKAILQMIEHPFIVNLITAFQDERRLFMVMEYINGGELFSYLRRQGRLPDQDGRFYASEIVSAFEYLHSMNIVYRDLKPENLLIDAVGHVKITDFGFAKIVEDRTWTLCGTPEYLAPEIIQSKGHGKSVDWWALGILIYEMLAGYPPFYDENPFGIYQKVLAGRIDFPKHIDVKPKDLIKRLLTHDLTKRYGCLKNGADDIKKHKWFKGVDWDVVYQRGMAPPFKPSVRSLDDTSQFDRYPESADGPWGSAQAISPKEQAAYFDDF
uniref:Protein kinase domain-containing protein n=1 Tax=Chromera velia CCMP2878 TaxID=1169474 RepID=A0A0G4G069_9ALVE|mmetsp:Transcript_36689/g.72180  ORF Transcript_36689/g.72180 Transcript_36689/m.72180 type:complete len:344 (+) Transcript_36689:217-1248(+)|eukprot:Cvel_19582.t1-p1 / transcript=Cvel_19582.t1 / gene=Cvel_19582 / organism=Chromera_velia_CCMP2878 / gene_product=cAMP-dependent protein kinase catalytic subunit, putative / transcript_product=cAMP-dependent protein kinase catalytic subunit, putative / location=Cvel_scaffold1700:3228-6797(-) / protein_length=343 / sequence_SO=supercontig / SO=protein_coding / is_pseudo=false